MGAGLVAIGLGSPASAKDFATEYKFPGKIYVDQAREVYQALGCNRGLRYVLNSDTLKSIKKSMNEGFSQGKTQGDSLQLGGTFIISATKGILFQHLEEFAGDHVDNPELLRVLAQIST
jgi:hypothetical protein